MQAVSANAPTVTSRLMRIMRLRVAARCMPHTSRTTSRFSPISWQARLLAPKISQT